MKMFLEIFKYDESLSYKNIIEKTSSDALNHFWLDLPMNEWLNEL